MGRGIWLRAMTDDTQRSLGRLEARADGADDRLERIEEKLDHLVNVVDQAKGGWKMLLQVGAASAAVGAFISWLVSWVRHP